MNIKSGTTNKHALESRPLLVSNFLMEVVAILGGVKEQTVKIKWRKYVENNKHISTRINGKSVLTMDNYKDFIKFAQDEILSSK